MTEIDRRDVLRASAAIPLAAVAAGSTGAPLSPQELRVLAMAATPAESWRSMEDYNAHRVYKKGSDLMAIIRDLHARELLVRHECYGGTCDCGHYFTASDKGLDELRKVGVEV